MRNKLIETYCKTGSESTDHEKIEIMTDVLTKPIAWHTPVQTSEKQQPATIDKIEGIVIGKLTDATNICVDYPSNPAGSPISAIATRSINATDVNRGVALTFQDGDPYSPIVLGFIEHPQPELQKDQNSNNIESSNSIDVKLDGEQLIFSADKEIVLKCGKASITLTKAGKILLRGAYLLSRSSGVNRIKGGSVQIN